jgi:hypothetical protein
MYFELNDAIETYYQAGTPETAFSILSEVLVELEDEFTTSTRRQHAPSFDEMRTGYGLCE